MGESAPAGQSAAQKRISTSSVASQQKLSNAERFAKMRESRDRARLRLEAAQEQIARLEAELKVAQLQQLKDSRSEAQVASMKEELTRLRTENVELRDALAGRLSDVSADGISQREKGLRAALAGAERAAADANAKLDRALATQSATQTALLIAAGVALVASYVAVTRRSA